MITEKAQNISTCSKSNPRKDAASDPANNAAGTIQGGVFLTEEKENKQFHSVNADCSRYTYGSTLR